MCGSMAPTMGGFFRSMLWQVKISDVWFPVVARCLHNWVAVRLGVYRAQ